MSNLPNKVGIFSFITAPFDLIAGASYPVRSLFFIVAKPQLWSYIIVPILINITIGAILYSLLLIPTFKWLQSIVNNFSVTFDTWIANLPAWLKFLGYFDNILGGLALTLFVIFLLIITGFILVQFGVILGAPWYGALSEKLEKNRLGKLPPSLPFSWENALEEIGRSVNFELKKLQIMITFGWPMLLLNFIPVFGSLLAAIGSTLLMSMIVCLDFINTPLDRRRLTFSEKLALFRSTLPASWGFGLVCLGLVSIPLLNLLVIPLCVASGTLFFCDRIWPNHFADQED